MRRDILVLLSFLFAILLSNQVLAESVFSGWIFEDQTITASGNIFEIRLSQDNTFLFLKSNETSIAVYAGDCEIEGTLKLCFYNATYDRDAKKNKANMALTENNPVISLLRYANKSSLYQGEKTNISVRIRNAGTYDAEDVSFEDDLQGFIVTEVTGCSSAGSRVYWIGDLSVNQTKTCSYKIYAEEIFEKTSKAKITYFDKEEKTIYSNAISFSISPLFKKDVYLNSEIPLGNITRIEINLSAKNNSAYLDSLSIKLSKGLLFNQSSYFKKSGEDYVWHGNVENITSITLSVQGIHSGYNEMTIEGNYALAGKTERFTEKKKIDVKKNDVLITTSLAQGEKADELSVKWIKVYAENKNRFARLKNIKITVDSPLFEPEKFIFSELNGTDKQMIFYLKKTIPPVAEQKSHKFNLNFSYETEFGEQFASKLENTLTIVPISKLEITKDLSNQNPKSEETITITTKIKNPRNKKVENVYVYDDVTPLSGLNSILVGLNSSETRTAYSYKLKMPYVRSEKEMNITTHISYAEEGKNYDYSYTKTIKIAKKDLKLAVTRKFPDVTRGNIFSTEYELSNLGLDELKNILLLPRKQENFDTIDGAYEARTLMPGEKIKFTLDSKAKENKSTQYLGERLIFEDNRGTQYEQNLTGETVTVLPFSSDAPIIYLNKTLPAPFKGEELQVNLSIKNIGESAQVSLYDEGHEWIFSLPRNAEKTFFYNKTFHKNGTIQITQARAEYNYLQKKISAYSKEMSVDVKERAAIQTLAQPKKQDAVNESKKTVLGAKTSAEKSGTSGSTSANTNPEDVPSAQAQDKSSQNNDEAEGSQGSGSGIWSRIVSIFNFVFGLD